MSCCGGSSFNIGDNPFGYLNGPYNVNNLGANFSMAALAELRQRGFSDEFLNSIDQNLAAEQATAAANAIRGNDPRQIQVDLPVNPDDPRVIELTRQRDIYQMMLNGLLAQQVTFPNNPYLQPDSIKNQILEDQTNIAILNAEIAHLNTVTINGLDLIVGNNDGTVPDNSLNCYTDVQYHIALTMISEDDARRFQTDGFNSNGQDIDINTLLSTNRADGSVTLASTGDVFTNHETVAGSNSDTLDTSIAGGPHIVETFTHSAFTRNYYNIVSLTTKNLTEPSESNPLVSTMLTMKMRIAEPHGFKFHEDIRNTALSLGYTDINPGRILYRVDISFSGYDQDTGVWTKQIDVSCGSNVKTISSVMSISNIDAEVTSSGTMYDVDLVPAGHHAYRPEDFIIDAGAIGSGVTFRDFLRNFSLALSRAKETRTHGRIRRNYEFYAPTALLDSPFDIAVFLNDNQFINVAPDPQHTITSGREIDIMTLLEGAIQNNVVAQELFCADINNDGFITPRIHWGVRFNTVYGQKDPLLNDYNDITHQYIIEPFITFKLGAVKQETIETYVDPSNQLIRIREIIRLGMLRRIYNYLYTAENTEVIDFDIKLKAFYYNTLNTARLTGSAASVGSQVPASDVQSSILDQNNISNVLNSQSFANLLDPNQNFLGTESTIKRLFGDYVGDSARPDSRHGADRLGGGFNETGQVDYFGDTSSPSANRRNDYSVYMQDYLGLDLLLLNGMKLRGDPSWLISPYSNLDISNMVAITGSEGISNQGIVPAITIKPRTGQIIFLRMLAPQQDDLMDPTRPYGSTYPNIIGGFYQVLSVVSEFENGKFTQTMDGAKLNHLNYAEDLFEGTSSRTSG